MVSEHYNADPYALSRKVRKRFREEKKLEKQRSDADNEIKSRYGLPGEFNLVEEDESAREEARRDWAKGRQELRLRDGLKRKRIGMLLLRPPTTTRLTFP